MKNKSVGILICLFLLSVIVHAETYYVSQNGSDNNSGRSPQQAWKTIRKVREGNTYKLKCGDTLFFRITKLYANEIKKKTGDVKIIIDSYGIGKKPVLSLYKNIKKANWENTGNNIWKIDMKNAANYSGYGGQANNDIGFLKVDEKIYGQKYLRITSLKKQWDFYCDGQFLYIYSVQNPASLYNKLLAPIDQTLVELSNNMELKNIAVVGTGGHAIQGNGVNNVLIRNVEVSDVGGSFLGGRTDGTRYGNGIEFFNSASNCLIERCKVSDVYDSGYTMQGSAKGKYFVNMTFRNNYANNNEQSFEFWVDGGKGGFKSCSFVGNQCYNAGYGWSHDVRSDKLVGVHILNYIWNVDQSDLKIQNNIFVNAKNGYIFTRKDKTGVAPFICDNNIIRISSATPVQTKEKDKKESIVEIQQFKTESGLDTKSKFIHL